VADIDVQRKQGQPAWIWIAAIVGLLAVVAVIWTLASSRDDRDDTRIRRDTVPAARDTPIGWIDGAGEATTEHIVLLG
jgi:hypothetical protein